MLKRALLLMVIFLWPCLAFRQATALQKFQLSGQAQGTTYHIVYYAVSEQVKLASIDSLFDALDASLSIYQSNSVISRFNRSSGGCRLDSHLTRVVKRSLQLWKATAGVSDITVYPAVKAWGFGTEPVLQLPDSALINKLKACLGSNKLKLIGNYLYKEKPCVEIDVNGIAQGYSVDCVAGLLERHRVSDYLVEVGGEIRIRGHKPDGSFIVGIEGPAISADAPVTIRKNLSMAAGAITTSGNYRKYVNSAGKRLSHLIDPRTGFPFQNELISVTVRAKDAMTADGIDNALMGMGLKRSFIFLRQHPELQAYFIYQTPDGAVADTASFGFWKR